MKPTRIKALMVSPGPIFTHVQLQEADGVLVSEELSKAWLAEQMQYRLFKARLFYGGAYVANTITVLNRDRDVPIKLGLSTKEAAEDDITPEPQKETVREILPLPAPADEPDGALPFTDPPGKKFGKKREPVKYVATPESEAALKRYGIRDRKMVNERARPERKPQTLYVQHSLTISLVLGAVSAAVLAIIGGIAGA